MSIHTQLSCNRCPNVLTSEPDLPGGEFRGWVRLSVFGASFSGAPIEVQNIHLCPDCYPRLIGLFAESTSKAAVETMAALSKMREVLRRDIRLAFVAKNADGTEKRVMTGKTIMVVNTPGEIFMGNHLRLDVANPHEWAVNEIKVGNRSQFSQSGDVPGDLFAFSEIDAPPTFELEICQATTPISIVVTYIGKNPEGATFKAVLKGRASGDGDDVVTPIRGELCETRDIERRPFTNQIVKVDPTAP